MSDDTLSPDELRKKGQRALWGNTDSSLRLDRGVARAYGEYINAHAFGLVWSRDGIPNKTRRLVTLGILLSNMRIDAAKLHLAAALKNGVTQEELLEVVIQVAGYAGMPLGTWAMGLLNEAIDNYEKENAAGG